jgi:alanine racemase
MSRQGAGTEQLSSLLPRFHAASPLKLEGIMTHLFAADEANGTVTQDQLALLDGVLTRIAAAGLHADWLNVGNSAALLAGQAESIAALAVRHQMKALLRPGIALYGLTPKYDPGFESAEPEPLVDARQLLKPVLSWKTKVVTVRSIESGAVVGYNGTFVASEAMHLALIAVGYADGLDRRLGNRFSLLIRGWRAPLVGRISMDQAVLDVTEIPGVQPGDEVVILGDQGEETISAFDHAQAAGTIPWEVFTRIGPRVQRIAL